MSDFEDLDPDLEQQLRDVPLASAEMKDAHIVAALAETPSARRTAPQRMRILSGVAAAVVLVVGGLTFVNRDDSTPPLTAGSTTSVPPKTGSDCSQEFSGLWGEVGDSKTITHNNQSYALMFRDDAIDIYQADPPCSSVGTLMYEGALLNRNNESSQPSGTSVCSYATEPIARFTDGARGDYYNLVLVQTETGLSLHFEDRCDTPIATLTLP